MPATTPPIRGQIPDLRQKLEYLFRLPVHGACRQTGSAVPLNTQSNLALVLPDEGDSPGKSLDRATLSRWLKDSRIPRASLYVPQICELYGCDERSFLDDSFELFCRTLEARPRNWPDLVATASDRGVTIQERSNSLLCPRGVSIDGEDPRPPEVLPSVRSGAEIEISFTSPGGVEQPRWADWHMLLFCGDKEGWVNWWPRYGTNKAFRDLGRFPRDGQLHLPRIGGQLKVYDDAEGPHQVVLMVSREPVQDKLADRLRQEIPVKELERVLDRLAEWYFSARSCEIVRGRFEVVHARR